MARSASAEKRAHEEAAAWFARLSRKSVSLQSLEDFGAWRRHPANRAAYQAVEALWRESGQVAGGAAIDAAVTDALNRGKRAAGPSRVWLAGIATASLALFAMVAVLTVGRGATYATRVGEQRLVRLDDGTAVRLDTDSKIAVTFRRGERRVQLVRGQAFFDVAHDAARPFIVNAGPMSVRDVGTRFDVRRDGAQAKVTLVEGVIQVRGLGVSTQAWTLKPGEQASLGRTPTLTVADVRQATSWTSGRVVFRSLPLAQAIEEINRYSPHKIRLAAQGVADVPVTGSFETGDVDAFVSAVSDLHGLVANKSADGTIVLDASSPVGA
jgi:transmembrane sensor